MSYKKIFKKVFLKGERIEVSFLKEHQERKEGDIWEENGKKWTIENGIKKTVSRFKELRKEILIPLTCPKCNEPMVKTKDPEFYRLFNMCLICKIEEDEQRKKDGTYEEYEKELIKKNKKEWVNELESVLHEFVEKHDSEYIHNEFGDVETVEQNMSKEELKELLDKQLKEIKENIK